MPPGSAGPTAGEGEASPARSPAQPLTGIRVLDLTSFLSGPFCTQLLGDLGAEIVKIESLDGDSSRAIPPYFVGEDSAYYLGNNRNKRSVGIDLKTPEGVAIAQELIACSDVVVENFRPGVCRRLGLDVDLLRAEHPSLIWASISGFGQEGPWRDRPAYDIIVQALSGVMSLTGEPGHPNVRLGIPVGDLVAGMYAALGVLGALFERDRTGKGRTIDISMLDGQLSMLSYQALFAMVGGIVPGPQGSRHDSIPTYRSFVAGDGRELVVAANTQRMWTEMCGVLDLAELTEDPRFADGKLRLQHKEELWPLLEAAFTEDGAVTWVEQLTARGIPAALIKTVPEALEDAKVAGRHMVVELEHADGRRVNVIGTPVKYDDDEPAAWAYPPRLGEDNAEVLMSLLGKTRAEVDDLQARRVLTPELGPDR